MWIVLLIFTTFSYGDDLAVEKYCFSSAERARLAQQKFFLIQVNSDEVKMDEHCLVIQMRPHRRELIQRYFLSTFPDVSITFSSEELKRDPCKLKVEKERIRTADDFDVTLKKNEGHVLKIDSHQSANEVMMIETTREFELTVDQDEIKGSCRMITPDKYHIEIEVKKNPKISLIDAPQPDQEISTIKSEIQIQRGQRVNLGEVIKNIKNKEHSVSLKPEIGAGTVQQTSTMTVFLSLQ